eukprot:1736538-Alexandrium_andersonii.AAC.1
MCIRDSAFEGFRHAVYEGRWGSVAEACGCLLLVESPLRASWDARACRIGHARAAQGDDRQPEEHRVEVETFDQATQSDEFWADARM